MVSCGYSGRSQRNSGDWLDNKDLEEQQSEPNMPGAPNRTERRSRTRERDPVRVG